MTCSELHRLLTIEPHSAEPRVSEHVQGCPECARFLEEALSFERRLRIALGVHRDDRSPEGWQAAGHGVRARAWSALAAAGRRALGLLRRP